MKLIDKNEISTWLFDLDNTLYKSETNLFLQIKTNITKFISINLNFTQKEAEIERIRLYKKFGTSLRGLMSEYKIKPRVFLEYVHDIDISNLTPNKKLNLLLKKIAGEKIIYTNASFHHAENILSRLGLSENFSSIFSIENAKFIPKPNIKSYKTLIDNKKINPKSSIMLEDTPWNLVTAFKLGMKTVLVETRIEKIDKMNKYIQYKTKNVEEFLKLYLDKKL